MNWRHDYYLQQRDALARMRNVLTKLCRDHGVELSPRLREDIDGLLTGARGSFLWEATEMVLRAQRADARATRDGEEPLGDTASFRLVD
jgi:hypothetical protein